MSVHTMLWVIPVAYFVIGFVLWVIDLHFCGDEYAYPLKYFAPIVCFWMPLGIVIVWWIAQDFLANRARWYIGRYGRKHAND